MITVPYVVDQSVRGKRFYGRTAQLKQLLEGPRNWIWLLGIRRAGKTSLLGQLRYLTMTSPERGYLPIIWDFQGCEGLEDLRAALGAAMLDADDRLRELDIDLGEIETEDLWVTLGRLRRKLRFHDLRLLLLCDNADDLITLNREQPVLMQKLHRALQSRVDIRSVLASGVAFRDLTKPYGDSPPFLQGFAPPLFLGALGDEEARDLIRQAHLPPEEQPQFDDATIKLLHQRSGNLPYSIQLICRRYLEIGDVDEACRQLATDRTASSSFKADFEMLSEIERHILQSIAERSAASSVSLQRDLNQDLNSFSSALYQLEHLGLIRRSHEGQLVLASDLHRPWLEVLGGAESWPPAVREIPAASDATLTMQAPLEKLDGRYELLQEIGAGASGIVYKAYDEVLQVKIAVKILRSELSREDEALERFRQEVILWRDISHPNVLRVYHLGEDGGRLYITMQLVEGPTLAQRISERAPFPESEILALGSKLTQALEAAHARNVLHRDIKPQNILVFEEEPFLTDFGLARLIGKPGITRTGLFRGTPYYSSPEQASLKPLDERSDLYSLGVVLYEMAAGCRPFQAATAESILEMHRTEQPLNPSEPRAASGREPLSGGLARVILRCLAKSPQERFQTAGELRTALEALGSG